MAARYLISASRCSCAHLRSAGLNPRKLPVQLEVTDELPRNAMGKVMKKQLLVDPMLR